MADKAVRLHDLDYPLEAGQYVQNGIVYQAVAERDLTPEEARAEVEAFMGEGWTHYVGKNDDETWVKSTHGYVTLFGCAPTLRPVVDALKASWRDAVRPWMEAAIEAKLDTADVDGYAPNERVIDRVCEKGMENV